MAIGGAAVLGMLSCQHFLTLDVASWSEGNLGLGFPCQLCQFPLQQGSNITQLQCNEMTGRLHSKSQLPLFTGLCDDDKGFNLRNPHLLLYTSSCY